MPVVIDPQLVIFVNARSGAANQVLSRNPSNTGYAWQTVAAGDVFLASSNTFTVGPQVVVSDDDAHACMELRAHSATQSAKIQRWAENDGTLLAEIHGDGAGNGFISLFGNYGRLYARGSIGSALGQFSTLTNNQPAFYTAGIYGSFCTGQASGFFWGSTDSGAGLFDTGLRRGAPGVVVVNDGTGAQTGTGAPGWMQNSAGRSRIVSDATNATATFADLSDLTLTLVAGRKYTGKLVVKCNNSTAAEGVKFDFNGGTATVTSFWAAAAELVGGTTVLGTAISTSLAGVINYTTITGETVIEFSISLVCNAGGTFIPRFAENSSTLGTATAELGSFLWLEDMPN